VPQVRLAPIGGFIAGVSKVAFGHDPKRANRGERPAVVSVQLVAVVAIEDELAFRSARQFQALCKRISRIGISFALVAVARLIAALANAIFFAIVVGQVHPWHVDIAAVVVAITGSKYIVSILDDARQSRLSSGRL
jgi:hypothetical protein